MWILSNLSNLGPNLVIVMLFVIFVSDILLVDLILDYNDY